MNRDPLLPVGQSTFIVAGPRAGKTSLLLQWLEACPFPSLYLALTPEDESPAFLLRRFLANWPEIRARFEAMRTEVNDGSWGAALGLAIAETHPDFCLLLDDFHLAEDLPYADELQAFLRHYPLGGTLVIASRHRAPELMQRSVWGGEDLGWREHPTPRDLFALPAALRRKALILHLIGESLHSPETEELVRRGLVQQAPDGAYRLKAPWQEAIHPIIRSRALEPDVWSEAEVEFEQFIRRHLGSSQERLIPQILECWPSEIRNRSPLLLRVEGDLLLQQGQEGGARACYLQALPLAKVPEREYELHARLLGASARFHREEEYTASLATLTPHRPILGPRIEVQLRYWEAIMGSRQGKDLDAITAAMERVLAIPACGDREILSFHIQALYALAAIHSGFTSLSKSLEYVHQLLGLLETHTFHRYLLMAHALHLYCSLTNRLVPLDRIVGIPDEAFVGASQTAISFYVICFGVWAFQNGTLQLALEVLELAHDISLSYGMQQRARQAKFWVLHILLRLGAFEPARLLYEELRSGPVYERSDEHLPLIWSQGAILTGRFAEAEAILAAVDGEPVRVQLQRFWLQDLQGKAGIREKLSAFLANSDHLRFLDLEPELAEHFGLRQPSLRFHLNAFGDLSFSKVGSAPPHWPRRKALSLLGMLVLHPEGLSSTDLQENLFRGSKSHDPQAALHTHSYNLRQVLSTIEADGILESQRGLYRLDWNKIAYCDLRVFERCYEKAQSLEDRGIVEGATLFYRLALLTVQGPLFANLPDEVFEEPRQAYAARVDYAQTFIKAHPLATSPSTR